MSRVAWLGVINFLVELLPHEAAHAPSFFRWSLQEIRDEEVVMDVRVGLVVLRAGDR